MDPTQIINDLTNDNNLIKDDNVTVPTSNCLSTTKRSIDNICPTTHRPSLAATVQQIFGSPSQQYLNTIVIKANQAIADSGATSIFIMEGTPVNNLRPLLQPLTINLPSGSTVKTTHVCGITITGLPNILTGHIVPELTIASLIGIRVLCKAGCSVLFTKLKCDVIYNKQFILRGFKYPATDLWTLPINATMADSKGKVGKPHKTQAHLTTPSASIMPHSHIPLQLEPTPSCLHTNYCATPRYPRS